MIIFELLESLILKLDNKLGLRAVLQSTLGDSDLRTLNNHILRIAILISGNFHVKGPISTNMRSSYSRSMSNWVSNES
jgi:hypothetical protein